MWNDDQSSNFVLISNTTMNNMTHLFHGQNPLSCMSNPVEHSLCVMLLSNEYQHDRVLLVFKNLCILGLCTKVASALGGLKNNFFQGSSALSQVCSVVVEPGLGHVVGYITNSFYPATFLAKNPHGFSAFSSSSMNNVTHLFHAQPPLMHVAQVEHSLCVMLLLGRHPVVQGCRLIVNLCTVAIVMVVPNLHTGNSVA